MTHFPDAFSGFVNDLFADEGDEPPDPRRRDLTLAELEELQNQYFQRLRDRIARLIEEQAHRSPEDWADQLTPLQLIIRDELLAAVPLAADEIEGLAAGDIVRRVAFRFMTLAWAVERAMGDEG